MLRHQLSPERTARGLEVLERSVQMRARVIEDLLQVSRSRASFASTGRESLSEVFG